MRCFGKKEDICEEKKVAILGCSLLAPIRELIVVFVITTTLHEIKREHPKDKWIIFR